MTDLPWEGPRGLRERESRSRRCIRRVERVAIEQGMSTSSGMRAKPFAVWVIAGGLVFAAILTFRSAKLGLRQKTYLASVRSTGGLLTLAVVGFVIGMLVAGTIGSSVILRNTAGTAADISIVPNAMSAAIPYSPATFTVAVGRMVTWINLDRTAHTVTSTVAGQFDSGSISTGQTWTWTFTQTGTYRYYCTYHPMMTGTVIVQ